MKMKKINVIRSVNLLLTILLIAVLVISCKNTTDINKDQEIKKEKNDLHPEWSKDAVIYEVNIRQFTPEGTFKAFTEHLPRLKEMGVDIIWLMPIHPIGEKNRKGILGSYYSVKDYNDVNPEFGSKEDFKALVDKAHELDMYVILDWVANHTAWDHAWMEEHQDWYIKDSTGKIVAPFDWTDVAELDYDKPGVREAMTDALKYWVDEFNIDGYRCDVAMEVPTDFWNNARQKLDSIKQVFMLAEAELPEHHEKAFHMSYAWHLHHILNQVTQGKENANTIENVLANNDSIFPDGSYRMQFTSNHDENSWNGTVYERMGDAALQMATLTYILPGMPLIYTGQEATLNKRLEFFKKDEVDWNGYPLAGFYTTLNDLKENNPALWNGNYGGSWERIKTPNDTSVFVLLREKDLNRVLGIFNFSDQTEEVVLSDENVYGEWNDAMNEETIELFNYLDRNDGDKKKYLEIPGEKFIHRFLCHIVPYRFVRIRHYGFLSTRVKKKCLQTIRTILKAKTPEKPGKLLCRDVILLVYGKDINICPTCKQGVLLTYGHWTKNKEPPAKAVLLHKRAANYRARKQSTPGVTGKLCPKSKKNTKNMEKTKRNEQKHPKNKTN